MMTRAIVAAGLAALATSAAAQDGGLTEDTARSFVETVSDDAQQAVEAGDWQGIATWMTDHVREEAPVLLSGSFVVTGGPSGTYDLAMTGRDLSRMAQMTAFHGSGEDAMPAIEDYELTSNVQSTWQVAGGGMGVAVMFYETGQIDAAAMAGGSGEMPGQGGAAAESPGAGAEGQIAFSSATTCMLHLGGSTEAVEIVAADCEATSVM